MSVSIDSVNVTCISCERLMPCDAFEGVVILIFGDVKSPVVKTNGIGTLEVVKLLSERSLPPVILKV